MTDLLQQQIDREVERNRRAYNKWLRDLQWQEQSGKTQYLTYARQLINKAVPQIAKGIQHEIDSRDSNTYTSIANTCIEETIGVSLWRKGTDRPHKQWFDLDLAVYLTVEYMINNAIAPAVESTVPDIRNTGRAKRMYPAVDRAAMAKHIGKLVLEQMRYKYLQAIVPDYFKNHYNKVKDNDGLRRGYHKITASLDVIVQSEIDRLRGSTDPDDVAKAEALSWTPPGSFKQVGGWLIDCCIMYADLFQQRRVRTAGVKTQVYIVLSDYAQQFKQDFKQHYSQFAVDKQPLLIPPTEATANKFGGWYVLQDDEPPNVKGSFEPSQKFVDYINNLQSVAYQVNPFVADVMDYLFETGRGLGKFMPYFAKDLKDAEALISFSYDWESRLDLEQLSDIKSERQRLHVQDILNYRRGRASRVIHQNTKELRKLDRFFFPFQWDFRGRVYCRCVSSPQPQGADYQKAAIRYAEAKPIDSTTRYYLCVEVANAAGYDKKPFNERINWTLNNEDAIKTVANFNNNPEQAIRILEQMSEPWQFLAAAEEYYALFITKTRTTTQLRCGVDMSCSAAGIHAGWRLDYNDAEAVNVVPTTSPQDVYMRVWNKLCELNQQQHYPIDAYLLSQWTANGAGRKAAKNMIMVFQYSAGIRKQMEEFYLVNDEQPSHLRFTAEQTRPIWKLFPKATAEVMSVSSVIKWFQDRVVDIYAACTSTGDYKIVLRNAAGCTQIMRYPHWKSRHVQGIHTTGFNERHSTGVGDIKAWKRAITANATHMCDSAVMVCGLHDFDSSFSTVHDAAHTYATEDMTRMLKALKRGYVEAVSLDIWDDFRAANNLPISASTDFPKTNNLDLDLVLKSDYMFA